MWFLPSWFTQLWWNTTQFNAQYGETIPCTANEMMQAIQGHLTLGTGFFGPDDSVIISNMTVLEWVLQYVTRLEESVSDQMLLDTRLWMCVRLSDLIYLLYMP